MKRPLCILIAVLSFLPAAVMAAQLVIVPPGNRLQAQPEIPRASLIRTEAFATTYDAKYQKILGLLRREPKLRDGIVQAAIAYGIQPIDIVGALVGEHTYNISAIDTAQGYYVKALAYANIDLSFSYKGIALDTFLKRPEFSTCRSATDSASLWSCRDTVWQEAFMGRTVDGVSYGPLNFQTAFFQPMYAGQTFGLGQISPLAALEVTDLVHRISGYDVLSADRPQAIYRDVMDPDRSLVYIAAIIRDAIDAYREQGFDISQNPGITATLYNLGQPRRRAMELRAKADAAHTTVFPTENYYGWLVNDKLAELHAIIDDHPAARTQ